MDRFRKLIACGVLFLTLVLSSGAVAPKEIRLERASYRKITISWQAPDATSQVAHYKIYRSAVVYRHNQCGKNVIVYANINTILLLFLVYRGISHQYAPNF